MANQTLTEAYNYITVENLQFQRNRFRWQFLLESYQGGEEYRRAGHLTRYVLETESDYQARLRSTPLDNHCRSVIQVYISFLFRTVPKRDLSSIDSELVQDFLRDADLDGRSFDNFMKDVATWSSVFGHAWIIMTKPSIAAQTASDQRAAGIRPYVSLLTPLVVTDWAWQRQPNGRYDLSYFKYIEDVNGYETVIREWTAETIRTWVVNTDKAEAEMVQEEVNELGRIPVILTYNQRGQVRGIGLGDISDIADQQRAIYNELSEVEQSIRLEGHPSVVVTPDVQMGNGAGSIIQMPENLDPGLKPYVLDTSAAPIERIYESIRNRIDAIDKMANTGGVRATAARTISGVALETEFQLLNARLSEKADNLELAEEQLWELWSIYEQQQWMGSIEYADSFNIRDISREFGHLKTATEITDRPELREEINRQLWMLLGQDPEQYPELAETATAAVRTYPDGTEIDARLPEAYQPSEGPEQQCRNCRFYSDAVGQCSRFGGAEVRAAWVCAAWEPIETEPGSE
jgi:hypothetical protein